MNPNLLLWPLLIHGLATLLLFVPMNRTRRRLVREGRAKAGVFRLNTEEPLESRQYSNAIRNQNESGVLYYAGLLTAYVSQNATVALVALAWLFLVLKLAHVTVHVTSNKLRYRFPVFAAALISLSAFWLVLAAQLAEIL